MCHLRATANYFVRVDVYRPGLLHTRLRKKKEIVFQPSNLAHICPPLLPTWTNATAMLAADYLNPEKMVPYQPPYLPSYSPSLRLTYNIPGPAVLYPGQPLNMEITVSLPEDLMERLSKIRFRSLSIALRGLTTVQAGLMGRTITSYEQVFSAAGDLVIARWPDFQGGNVPLDSAIWDGHLVPTVLPTFRSANISRQYVLEVIAGFSSGGRKNVERVVLALLALISDEEIVSFSGSLTTAGAGFQSIGETTDTSMGIYVPSPGVWTYHFCVGSYNVDLQSGYGNACIISPRCCGYKVLNVKSSHGSGNNATGTVAVDVPPPVSNVAAITKLL
ncbi:hypothetical protein BR93DRAFT_971657 [Coniochaeta sp. PMI_546]|nr:hypothetical protein BR93DRAFT_971657 [Coniochaeta sp. PMI_546]